MILILSVLVAAFIGWHAPAFLGRGRSSLVIKLLSALLGAVLGAFLAHHSGFSIYSLFVDILVGAIKAISL